MMDIKQYLDSVIKEFKAYKELAEKAMIQVNEKMFFTNISDEPYSLAIIVKHVAGNLRSRWLDFLTTDGEKPDRNRDSEFEIAEDDTRSNILKRWEYGWQCLFATLSQLDDDAFETTIYIRSEPHSVVEAINRSLAHTAYHVGQIVLLAKQSSGDNWQTLSIPRGKSDEYTQKLRKKFGK
jgi:hypothetical protein